jgi:hypothetical protein
VDEMKSRRIDDLNDSNGSQVLVYDLKTQSWQYIPQHIGVYTLGFPCAPWSMKLAASLKCDVVLVKS